MVSSVGGTSSLQSSGGTPGTSTVAVKKALDMEKQLGNAVVQLIEEGSIQKGSFVDIKV